jgi:class 3 adenylate cyclase
LPKYCLCADPGAPRLKVRGSGGAHGATGLVVVGSSGDTLRMDYTAVGDTTHLATRLQQSAPPGGILMSQATCQLVQDQVYLEAMAPLPVKGLDTPVASYTRLGTWPRQSPGVRLLGAHPCAWRKYG